jgi:hypothetical protein
MHTGPGRCRVKAPARPLQPRSPRPEPGPLPEDSFDNLDEELGGANELGDTERLSLTTGGGVATAPGGTGIVAACVTRKDLEDDDGPSTGTT